MRNTPSAIAAKGYSLRPAAVRALEEIWRFTAQTWSPAQAEAYSRKLFAAFNQIVAEPKIAREHEEYAPTVRILRVESHVVIYHLAGDQVDIIRVRHGREDWMSDPEGAAREAPPSGSPWLRWRRSWCSAACNFDRIAASQMLPKVVFR